MVARSTLEKKLSPKSLFLFDELIQSLKAPVVAFGDHTGRRLLSGSQAYVEAERERFDLVAEALLLEVSRIRVEWNAFSPIHRLPTELLSQIFLIGALEDIRALRPLPLSTLAVSHVCRLWRQTSLSTPSLWTLFHSRLPVELASRAQGLPQDFLVIPGSSWWGSEETKPSLLKMRSLRINVTPSCDDDHYFNLSNWVSLPTPNLSTLQLSGDEFCDALGDHRSQVTAPRSPLPGQQGLREVIISRCALAWDSSIFVGLHRLDLYRISDDYRIHTDELLSILAACPALADLSFRKCDLGVRGGAALTAVTLPRLRSFLWDTPIGDMALQKIFIPTTVELTFRAATSNIHGVLRENHDAPHSATADDAALPIQIALSRCRYLTFGYPDPDEQGENPWYTRDIILEAREEQLALLSGLKRSHRPGYDPNLFMIDFIDHLSYVSNIRSLGLSRVRLLPDSAAFIRLMHALPDLVEVVLSGNAPECENAIFVALGDTEWDHHISEITLHQSRNSLASLVGIIESCVESTGKSCVRKVTLRDCDGVDAEAAAALEALVDVEHSESRAADL
ncbi:hypothetical protein BOTBODRAFT_143866 [Botryobasidium botryosum FD-172 SS1]|uniref:Uncharacterized protein n=1 Tax=Botryobasidium botryosum (strain FD-172 SS1) TaxID=930990 RepID=A0A067MRN4_BOTB1|nr:hypothetical protein BOTBODRAFT_143866 [Botryobasidium botryosum FD-172 SS1]